MLSLKASQLKTVCKDESGCITRLKLQKIKKIKTGDFTCQHI